MQPPVDRPRFAKVVQGHVHSLWLPPKELDTARAVCKSFWCLSLCFSILNLPCASVLAWDKNIMGEYRNIDKCGVSRSKMVSGAPNLMAKVDELVKKKEQKAVLKFPSKQGGSQVEAPSPSIVSGASFNSKEKGCPSLDFTSTTMEWQMQPAKKKRELEGECHQAWALFFFYQQHPISCD